MARVSEETLEKLNSFIESLPQEARSKCALCSETLTHIVKMAEVQTGAGTATVTRVLSEKLNENAAPGDRVSGEALNQRVRYNEGLKCQSDIIKSERPSNEHFRTSFTGDNEWYTPIQYIEAAREVMGSIDLDPATSAFGQSRIKADTAYTEQRDGLSLEWSGNVWLNPPYSQPLIFQFIEKLVSEWTAGNLEQAILLTHNFTDTAWFHLAESEAALLCFTKGRVKFEKEDRVRAAPTQGSAFFYFGERTKEFTEIFGQFGFIR
ncbi:MAG: DNA N-6-adenine-methyltransferase [Candidatus Margulisiibacteriota bacterium]